MGIKNVCTWARRRADTGNSLVSNNKITLNYGALVDYFCINYVLVHELISIYR